MSKTNSDKNTNIEEETSSPSEGEEVEIEFKSSQPESDGEDSLAEGEKPQEEAEEAPPSLKEQLRAKEDQYLRLAAEFDNFRKRSARQFTQVIESAQADIYAELLTVIDNFHRALEVKNGNADFDSYRKGVELIYAQLTDFLKKNDVEAFDSVGEKFDPNLHDAMMTVPTEELEEGTVVEEFAKGYKLKDRVLRHARVAVAQPPRESQESE